MECCGDGKESGMRAFLLDHEFLAGRVWREIYGPGPFDLWTDFLCWPITLFDIFECLMVWMREDLNN